MPLDTTEGSDVGNNKPTVGRNVGVGKKNKAAPVGKNNASGGKKEAGKGKKPTEQKNAGKQYMTTRQRNVENNVSNNNEKKSQRQRLLNRAQVPNTWTQKDLEKNIKELEAKAESQQIYNTVLEAKTKTNDELLKHMKGMNTGPESLQQNYKNEIEKLGDETGSYEREIKLYTTMTETSDASNKMAQEAYSGNQKYSKRLQKTLSLLQDKAVRLHDNQDVMECRKAVRSLQKERDREERLMEKLLWYQEKVQQCQVRLDESCKDLDDDNVDRLSPEDDGSQHVREEMGIRNFSGNNTCTLPSINRARNLRNLVKADSPRPDGNNNREKWTTKGQCRLASVGKPDRSAERGHAQFDLSSLLEDDKTKKIRAANRKIKLPNIGINQKVTDMKHLPSPPKTPKIVQKIRSFFGWK